MSTENEILYGQQTQLAINNFGRGQLPNCIIKAYAEVKLAAQNAIQQTEKPYTKEQGEWLKTALQEIIAGKHDAQFPLPLEQGGAGTSINMNLNEVVANLVARLSDGQFTPHPIDTINRYQSTNDTFATAVTIVLLREIFELEKHIIEWQEALVACEQQYEAVLMTGRTEMQDALPITLGQVFGSWAGMAERDRWRLHKLKERVRQIALGGTAMGTCYPAPQNYIFKAEQALRQITGLPLARSQNLVDEISHHDKWAETAGALDVLAGNLYKFAADLLYYTSSAVGELSHPNLQYGSSIMGAKTNPVMLEFITGLSIDTTYEARKASTHAARGNMQLNAMVPFMLQALLKAFSNLKKALNACNHQLLPGLTVNHKRIKQNLMQSPALLNALLPIIGYQKVKQAGIELVGTTFADFDTYKEAVAKATQLSKEQINQYLSVELLTGAKK